MLYRVSAYIFWNTFQRRIYDPSNIYDEVFQQK